VTDQPNPPMLRISPTAAELATSVANELLDRVVVLQGEGRVPAIALTGGTIADAIHAELARLTPESGVDWSRVDIWWGDERYVTSDSPDRNAGQARIALLDHVDVDPARVHEMPDSSFGDLESAATAYGDQVRAYGSGEFDVVMLGLGPDGHVASLFPGYPQLDVDDRIAVAVTESPKPPPQRISLTFAALNRTAAVWFLVSGEGKAAAVASALAGGDPHEIPARGVHAPETVWFLDQDAASRL